MFVIHFVGDLHQPLHSANNGDRGGNEVHIVFQGNPGNLHSLWDGTCWRGWAKRTTCSRGFPPRPRATAGSSPRAL